MSSGTAKDTFADQSAGSRQQSSTRETRTLRLPSFHDLGIAFPHPDWDSSETHASLAHLRRPRATLTRHLVDAGSTDQWPRAARQASDPTGTRKVFESTSILTPPAEKFSVTWSAPAPRLMPVSEEEPPIGTFATLATKCSTREEQASGKRLADLKAALGENADGWLEAVTRAAIGETNVENFSGSSMKLLSHALPTPSVPGHAFPTLISALRTQLPNPLLWVNLLHAVPGRFNLVDLPISPPSTPGIPYSGGDYFTTKVFDQAIPAFDFERSVSALQPQAYSSLLAPPGSLDFVLVERFIPPPSSNEFSNLFNIKGPSLIVDRLVELSNDNGCLVFIYPTKTGAQTFLQDYLCPIIDPILRAMVVVNGFSADLAATLGRVDAVSELHEFEQLHENLESLCRKLSTGGDSSGNGEGAAQQQCLYGASATFTLAYAAKHEVALDGSVWADWWVKQEKPRVRTVIGRYFRQARRLPMDAEIMPIKLIQEVLDGVTAEAPRRLPAKGVEVGVFIVRRNGWAERRH